MEKLFHLLNIKRGISLLLALCLVIGLMPLTAFATDLTLTISANPGVHFYLESDDGISPRNYCVNKFYETLGSGPQLDDLVEIYIIVNEGCYIKTLKANSSDLLITDVPTGSVFADNYTHYVRFRINESTHITLDVAGYRTVNFDANTGSGTMGSQTFESDRAEKLSANTFIKPGYVFIGWNTKADGSGDAYTDTQTAKFIQNEPETTTLYAQWEECTNHTWENRVCTKCDLECTHSGYIYAGSGSVITEKCENQCGHNETATIERDTSVSTTYTGAAIEALKVIYSAGWKGGSLDISYSDNINVGAAQGTIAKAGGIATATFDIERKAAIEVATPIAGTITYGQKLSDSVLDDVAWEWADGNILPTVNNGGYTAYYTPADTSNYDWTAVDGWDADLQKVVRTVPITVIPKELTITWGNVNFVYDGTEKFPEFIMDGIITGDDVVPICSDFEINANAEGETYTATITGIEGADAANYKLPSNTSQEFTIARADQDAPAGLEKTDETAPGMSDRTITNISANIEEHRKGNEVAITDENGICKPVSVSSDSQSPQTGDNSNMALWLGLLFFSSGVVIKINFIRRKERTFHR